MNEEQAAEIACLRDLVHIMQVAHEQLQRTLDERCARISELWDRAFLAEARVKELEAKLIKAGRAP
jgi:hypothetical protein